MTTAPFLLRFLHDLAMGNPIDVDAGERHRLSSAATRLRLRRSLPQVATLTVSARRWGWCPAWQHW